MKEPLMTRFAIIAIQHYATYFKNSLSLFFSLPHPNFLSPHFVTNRGNLVLFRILETVFSGFRVA